jgi:hypothetical protein
VSVTSPALVTVMVKGTVSPARASWLLGDLSIVMAGPLVSSTEACALWVTGPPPVAVPVTATLLVSGPGSTPSCTV